MNENAKPDARTPGRRARARAGSAWGRADLVRRVARLPIPEEARARVARFVEDEVEKAKEAWLRDSAPLAGIECPKCKAPIEEELRKRRRDEEIVQVLSDVPVDEIEKLIEQTRS